ncbi:MAG: right-handed parallel beta-helix repeat-containing protein [Candidatus Thermoplasmatota archaeon]|nr:right-handed parallel beta-helix repeat-containing protein [Candidatus Thermoplasmatota archaeon]
MAENDLETSNKLNDSPLYTKFRYINSTTFYVNEPIVVTSGEKLVIDNTRMVFNCSYDGEHYMMVSSGGGLEIRNGSYLTINRTGDYSDNYGYNYYIQANVSSTIYVLDSNISFAGSREKVGYGFIIKCDSAFFFNVSFYNCFNPICQELTSNSIIDGCLFINIKDNAVQFIGDQFYFLKNHKISNSTFLNIENSAIKFNNILKYYPLLLKNTIITNNTINNSNCGIDNVTGEYYCIGNNIISNCRFTAIQSDNAINVKIFNNNISSSKKGIYSRDGLSPFTITKNNFYNIEINNIELLVQVTNVDKYRVMIDNNTFIGGIYGIKGMCTDLDITDNLLIDLDNAIDIYHFNYANPPSSININKNTIKKCNNGIISKENDKLRIEKNIISNIRSDAISIDKVLGYDIEKNIMDNIRGNGIKMTNSLEYIGYLVKLDSNVIRNCSTGIYMSSNEPDIMLKGNVIENCTEGVGLRYMDGGGLSRNNISECGKGIVVESSAKNLVMDRNNLIGNDVHAVDEGANTWDNGTWGNYWSNMEDYHDWDGNGIVDHPIYIDADSVDRYPLIVPWGQPWNRKIELDPFIAEHRVEASKWLNLTFTASDPDGDGPLFVIESDREVDFDLNNDTGEFSFRPKKEDVGLVEFNITVYDRNGTRDTGEFVVEVLYLNLPPQLEPVDNITIYPGIRVEKELFFHDPNGDNVAVYVDSTNAPFRFSIKDNRYLVFTAGDDQTGVFWMKLTLSDGNGSLSQYMIDVIVIPYNVPPVIGDMFGLVAYVGETSSLLLNVSDVNGDELTINISYDGNGSCWVEGMQLMLRPDITDVGNRTLTVKVNDNNGSFENRTFAILVLLRNRAPLGPDHHLMRVEAGDVQTDQLLVVDLDGDTLSIASIEPKLDWVKVDLPDWFEVTATPSLDEVGTKGFIINVTDGRGGYLDIVIEIMVFAGPPPIINFTDSIIVKEKEVSVYVLGTDYKKNGTIGFRVISDLDFVSLIGDRLSFEPVHGDHGNYILHIETFVHGGSSRITNHTLRIDYDLSTLNLTIKVGPEKEHYREGETLRISLTYSGYEADLDLKVTMETYPGGIGTIDSFEGKEGTFKLKEEGLFAIYVIINDHGYFGDPSIIKVESVDGPDTPFYRFINIGIVLLMALGITILGIAIYLRSRRDGSTDTTADRDKDSVDQGPDGPNGPVIDGTIPPGDVGPPMEDDNDQNIVPEGTGDVQEVPDLGSIEITSIMEGLDPTIPKPDGPPVQSQVDFK